MGEDKQNIYNRPLSSLLLSVILSFFHLYVTLLYNTNIYNRKPTSSLTPSVRNSVLLCVTPLVWNASIGLFDLLFSYVESINLADGWVDSGVLHTDGGGTGLTIGN